MPAQRDILRPGAINQKKYDSLYGADKGASPLDAIVVGSGPSGLASAAALSKAGWRVAVFEQHDVLGGTTHCFVSKDRFEFDTGLHYVGASLAKSRLFDYLFSGKVSWSDLDADFDVAVATNGADGQTERVVMTKGGKALINRLCKQFPEEEVAIKKYFAACRKWEAVGGLVFLPKLLPRPELCAAFFASLFVIFTMLFSESIVTLLLAAALGAGLGFMIEPLVWLVHGKFSTRSTREVMKECGLSDKMMGVLSYNWGDYGTLPGDSPFFVQASHIQHWMGGGFYPKGGPQKIAESIVPSIEAAGGSCYVRSPVDSILMGADADGKNLRAVGVSVKGVNVMAPVVIACTGVAVTMSKLLPPSGEVEAATPSGQSIRVPLPADMRALQAALSVDKKEASTLTPATSILSLFVGIEGSSTDLNLPANNLWVFPTWDHHKNAEVQRKSGADGPFAAGFVAFPSKKDCTWEQRWPGTTVCEVLVPIEHDIFTQWKDTRLHARGADYDNLKEELSQRMLKELLYRFYPQTEGKVVHYELGTSLTNNFYFGTENGEVYGLDHNVRRFSPEMQQYLRPRTGIKGLYLSGQDISLAGIIGGLFSGLFTTLQVSPRAAFKVLLGGFTQGKGTRF